jgi:hypothetical protein
MVPLCEIKTLGRYPSKYHEDDLAQQLREAAFVTPSEEQVETNIGKEDEDKPLYYQLDLDQFISWATEEDENEQKLKMMDYLYGEKAQLHPGESHAVEMMSFETIAPVAGTSNHKKRKKKLKNCDGKASHSIQSSRSVIQKS